MAREVQKGTQQAHISTYINSQLALKRYTPPEIDMVPDHLAALATNEKLDERFFQSIKTHNPDGYIVGVGCGMSLALPLGFKKDTSPKGVVLIDTDKHVVSLTKAFTNALQQTNNFGDFYNRFYRDPINLASTFLAGDLKEKEILEAISSSKKNSIKELIDMSRGDYMHRITQTGRPSIDNILGATYEAWKKLAQEGKIAVIHGSLADQPIIETITNLPKYKAATNLIYISNIANHIVKGTSLEQAEAGLTPFLQSLEQYSDQDHQSIFIDTLRGSNYWLRASKGTPKICPADVHIISDSMFPEGFKMPNLHFKKFTQKFTSLDLSIVEDEELNKIQIQNRKTLYESFPDIDR